MDRGGRSHPMTGIRVSALSPSDSMFVIARRWLVDKNRTLQPIREKKELVVRPSLIYNVNNPSLAHACAGYLAIRKLKSK